MRTTLALTRFELKKLWRQKKNLVGALNVVLINGLFVLAFLMIKFERADQPHRLDKSHLWGDFLNAYAYTQLILPPTVNLLFPMVLAVVAGYMLAGEFELGNLRMMMFRPIARWQIIIGKFIAISVYGGALLLLLLVLSYTCSALMFEPKGLVLLPGEWFALPPDQRFIVLTADEMAWRIPLSYLLAWPMVMSMGAMALMFAVITRHFTSAAIITSTVYFCSWVVGNIDFLSGLRPYLPTTYWPFFNRIMQQDIPWDVIARHAGWTAAYTAVFLGLAITVINTRDA